MVVMKTRTVVAFWGFQNDAPMDWSNGLTMESVFFTVLEVKAEAHSILGGSPPSPVSLTYTRV